jgi:polysaccharide pyruvyl transferase WcaK-like protein
VGEILRIAPDTEFLILDNGTGVRRGEFTAINGTRCTLAGARNSRRYWRTDSYANIQWGVRLGGLGAIAREIRGANAILDISGGDSFTDLYGPKRLRSVMYPKQIALENDIPLVLLPQTYGPFEHAESRALAQRAVRGALRAYARDAYSFEVLRQLAGDAFNPERHAAGVDVAFLLPAVQPPELPPAVEAKLANPALAVAGVNVSGLIYNDPAKAKSQYGIALDYRAVVRELVTGLLQNGADAVWLIPHVLTPVGHYESDLQAAHALRAELEPVLRERVHVLEHRYDQSQVKWVIARCDWFCGTRMHATIAALSSGVPTAALAYSGKTAGVFASVGAEDNVLDARSSTANIVASELVRIWMDRESALAILIPRLGVACTTAQKQVASIVQTVRGQ